MPYMQVNIRPVEILSAFFTPVELLIVQFVGSSWSKEFAWFLIGDAPSVIVVAFCVFTYSKIRNQRIGAPI